MLENHVAGIKHLLKLLSMLQFMPGISVADDYASGLAIMEIEIVFLWDGNMVVLTHSGKHFVDLADIAKKFLENTRIHYRGACLHVKEIIIDTKSILRINIIWRHS